MSTELHEIEPTNIPTPRCDAIPRRAPFHHYFVDDVMAKAKELERENVRLREALQQIKQAASVIPEWKQRAEKAEAEVAELRSYIQLPDIVPTPYSVLHSQLTRLQQDVRPLVLELESLSKGATLIKSVTKEALATFLAKHPECKPV